MSASRGAAMPLSAQMRLGPYEILEPLGAGGMGEVYRARDPRLGRDVAVKLITTEGVPSPERLRRFETEARAAAQLSHPNVITVFDVGTHEGQPYLVLELLEGRTLREALRGQPPTLHEALTWMMETARGLGAAHERGIVHRDLKPENIFLTKDGRVKVLDFGLAKLYEPLVSEPDRESPTETKGTRPGAMMGTVGYMAPEQVRGETPDPRTDVFALGTVLYEVTTGRRPFGGASEGDVLAAVLRDEPPAPSSLNPAVPPSLDQVVRRCLAKEPPRRFSSAREVAAALETVLASLGPGRLAQKRPPEPRGPYPGLSSFKEADAESFFGREAEIAALWERLRERPLLAVIGPSGVGKTSFVRAGVLAGRPSGWGALVCTPGRNPFKSLGRALAPELSGDPEALQQLVSFDEPDTALGLMGGWRRGHDEALLVVDQFEELFTLSSAEEQERFADLLGRLTTDADVHVLLSLRDDFLMRCGEHEALRRVFTELTPLLPLSGEGLRRALEEPAKREGYSFEEGLVEEMLQAVEGARGALPLLAFAVSRVWEKRDREEKVLTRVAYDEIGGVAGALAQHAESTLARIGPQREGMVREIFRNLVTAQGTRASSEREELLSVFPEREGAEDALEELIEARLLTSYEVLGAEGKEEGQGEGARRSHRIEIVHESLLKAWPRLVWWQAQDEEGAQLRDQLKQAAHLWEEKGRPDDLLWTGTSEREFELWRERYSGKLTAVEESYASAMVERARRRRRLRRLAVAAVVGASLGVAAIVGLLRQQAVREGERAREEARRAEASKLLALAQARLEEDPTEALALTTASLRLADTAESRALAVRALGEAPPARELDSGNDYQAPYLAFSPDGARLAKAGWDAEVRVWTEDGQGPERLPGHDPAFANKAEWASAGLLVAGSDVDSSGDPRPEARWAHVWSFPEGRRVRTIEFGQDTWWQVGAERLFAATFEHAVGAPRVFLLRSWRLPDGEPEVLGRVHLPPEIGMNIFEPGGRAWLYAKGRGIYRRPLPVAGGRPDELLLRHGAGAGLYYFPSHPYRLFSWDREPGEIRIWSFAKGQPELAKLIPRPGTASEGSGIMPDPSGQWVVELRMSEDRQARLWSTASLPGARSLVLRRSGSWSFAGSALHPTGDWFAAATHATSHLTFWPLGKARSTVVDGYEGFAGQFRPVSFSHDSRWLATSWTWQGIRLWPLPGSGHPGTRTLPLPGMNVAGRLVFDPDDRFLFVVRGTLPQCIVPLDGSPARELESPNLNREYYGTSFSPSGRSVATASNTGKGETALAVWDVETGERRLFDLPKGPVAKPLDDGGAPMPGGFEGAVNSVHFVDETTLYTAGVAGVLRWDLKTGTHETVFAPEPGTEVKTEMSAEGRTALARRHRIGDPLQTCEAFEVLQPTDGTREPLTSFGECPLAFALDPSGTVAVTGDFDGVVRVGRLAGGEPYFLFGHEGAVDSVAISPDLRWVASSGEDNTLRLWPMPDLDKPPLHTLPHHELIAKLESLTNLRAVRDAESATGWTIELGPFPGWKDVPTW